MRVEETDTTGKKILCYIIHYKESLEKIFETMEEKVPKMKYKDDFIKLKNLFFSLESHQNLKMLANENCVFFNFDVKFLEEKLGKKRDLIQKNLRHLDIIALKDDLFVLNDKNHNFLNLKERTKRLTWKREFSENLFSPYLPLQKINITKQDPNNFYFLVDSEQENSEKFLFLNWFSPNIDVLVSEYEVFVTWNFTTDLSRLENIPKEISLHPNLSRSIKLDIKPSYSIHSQSNHQFLVLIFKPQISNKLSFPIKLSFQKEK